MSRKLTSDPASEPSLAEAALPSKILNRIPKGYAPRAIGAQGRLAHGGKRNLNLLLVGRKRLLVSPVFAVVDVRTSALHLPMRIANGNGQCKEPMVVPSGPRKGTASSQTLPN
jgi:hypothetical protein